MFRISRITAALLLAPVAYVAQAQVLEELDARQEFRDAVIQIKFSSPVSLLRSSVSRTNDLVQVYYRSVGVEDRSGELLGKKLSYTAPGLPTVQVAEESIAADTIADANRRLIITLKPGAQLQVRSGKNDRTIDLVLLGLGNAKPGTGTQAGAEPIKPVDAELQQQAAALLTEAQLAHGQNQLDVAAQKLAKILEMPPTAVTADAQELMGMVRQAQGDPARARAEYEAYLKQYPEGAGSDRVRGRLAGLSSAPVVAADVPKKPDGSITLTGSWSQYYYGGKSTIESETIRNTDGTPLTPDQIDQSRTTPVSNVDQNLLTSSVDATWRSLTDERDIKAVVRDQLDYNMIGAEQLGNKSRTRNRLSAAYLDYKVLDKSKLTARLGRQSAMWGGEGRYDGVSGSYVIRPKMKVSAAMGVPTDDIGQSHRYFVGAALDADGITPNLGASASLMQRMIDGEVDRRSVGVDLRYYNQNASVMSSTDYDILFNKLNSFSLMGMYTASDNATYNVLFERRSQLPASLSQVLFFQFQELQELGIMPGRIGDLLSRGYTVDELQELVRMNTSYSSHALLSMTRPINDHWQVGADLDLKRFGAIAPNPVLPQGQNASAPQRTLGLQIIGSNLYSTRDTSVVAVSFMNSRDVKTQTFSFNNMTTRGDAWQFDPSLRWQSTVVRDTTTGLDITTSSWGPTFKVLYKPRPYMEIESSLTMDFNKSSGITNVDRTRRYSYFLGYRYTR